MNPENPLLPDIVPPLAVRRSHEYSKHGRILSDPYHWLRDPDYPEFSDPGIEAYLRAENAYYERAMAPHQALVEQLFEEFKGRIEENDRSVPWRRGDWFFQWRFAAGAAYRTWWRRSVSNEGDWQCFLDEPRLAGRQAYFHLGAWDVDPSGRLLAYAVDDNGAERYGIRMVALDSGERIGPVIENTFGAPVWAADGRTLVYVEVDSHWRPWRVRAHRLGVPVDRDRVLYEEVDEGFRVSLSRLRSGKFLLLSTGDHVTTEQRLLVAADPCATPVLVASRSVGHEYDLDHANGRLYIRSNDRNANFRLVSAPDTDPSPSRWREEIAASDACHIRCVSCCKGFYALEERLEGLDQVRICDYRGDTHRITFPEPVYEAGLGMNEDFDTPHLQLRYSSMVTPHTVYAYEVATRRLRTLKVQQVPGGYRAREYVCERLHAPARDGVRIPVSIVYRRDACRDGRTPLHLYGYGAYGYAVPPSFSATRLSLLERGMAYAIAHVRGGDELGPGWYEAGKLDRRTNTFNDFVDVARHLVKARYTSRGSISMEGASAGGGLVAAAVNQAPGLWSAAVLEVPFVDILNTMLDATLPLTPPEWPEWGNPDTDPEMFDYILGYSPYDRIRAQAYPPMLVTGGINDPRVTYWEPAKWVARLRHEKLDNNPLLFKIDMNAGHGGKSGRYERLRELAEQYAFILLATGQPPPVP